MHQNSPLHTRLGTEMVHFFFFFFKIDVQEHHVNVCEYKVSFLLLEKFQKSTPSSLCIYYEGRVPLDVFKERHACFPKEKGQGTPLQDSCLENPMDRGAWWAIVHGVAKSQTRLSD